MIRLRFIFKKDGTLTLGKFCNSIANAVWAFSIAHYRKFPEGDGLTRKQLLPKNMHFLSYQGLVGFP